MLGTLWITVDKIDQSFYSIGTCSLVMEVSIEQIIIRDHANNYFSVVTLWGREEGRVV